MDPEQKWNHLEAEIVLLEQLSELLGWDQETYLPPAAIPNRSEQSAYLQGRLHRLWTSEETREVLQSLHETGEIYHDARLRYWRRELGRRTRIPQELVERQARATVRAQAAWAQARKHADFPAFLPHLEELVTIARAIAACLGDGGHPYDALLDHYEPGATVARLDPLFARLSAGLNQLLEKHPAAQRIDAHLLHRRWRKADLEAIDQFVLQAMGFDLSRGRVDETTHPFCTTLGPDDVRLTTRFDLNYLPTSLYGVIHEMGHGLYEQGFAPEIRGTLLARGASLGLHESQSRFWENLIARSPAWAHWFVPHLARLSHHVISVSEEADFARAVNRVERSFIRVEADELTYALHIVVRYELEKDLIAGRLECRDVPAAWNEAMHRHLGIVPPNDSLGCLQDIHWSMGGFGYFPTYALGNLYAAHFLRAMRRDLEVDSLVARGEFAPILEWLRARVHRWGATYSAEDILRRATGDELDTRPFLDYLDEKYQALGC